MTRRRTPIACATALAVACSVALSSRAYASSDATDLRSLLEESVVTTASQTAETETTSPGTSTIITADDLQKYGITTVAQALDFLSLGVVTSDPLHDVEVGSRGVLLTKDRGAHFLLLIDGHAQNEPLYGSMNVDRGLGLPIELIDHVEVVLGPGSVLYGSNAMLGVINVVTKRAKDDSGVHLIAQSEVARSYRFGVGFGAQMTLFGKPAELTFASEYQLFNGGPITFPLQDVGGTLGSGNKPERFGVNWATPGFWGGTATHQYYQVAPSGYARLKIGDFEASLHGSLFKEAYPYFDSANRTSANFDDSRNASIDRRASLDLKYRATLSPIVALSFRGYGDLFDRQNRGVDSRYGGCLFGGGVNTCDTREVGLARWAGLEVQGRFDWTHDDTIVTLVGVDPRFIFVGNKLDTLDADTGRPLRSSEVIINNHDETLGAYIEQVLKPTRWVELNLGARLDVGREYSPVVSPRGAVLFRPWTGGALKLAYSEAFRAPTWYERDAQRIGLLASENLQPERVYSTEASIEQRFGTQRLRFGVYRTWWRDLIADHTLTTDEINGLGGGGTSLLANNITQYRNVTAIDSYGYDALFEGSLLAGTLHYGLNVSASYTRQRGDAGTTVQLPVAPQAFGNARLAYDLPGALPTIAIAAQIIGPRLADNFYGSGFTTPPTVGTQIALRFNVVGPVPAVPGLTYTAGISYTFGDAQPYVAGPVQKVSDTIQLTTGRPSWTGPDLVPVDHFRALVGLRYDFGAAGGSR